MEESNIIKNDEEARKVFAHRLKRLRLDKCLILRDLAKILREKYNVKCTYGSLGNYERTTRTPNFFLLIKLAEYFDVTIDYLLGKTDIKNDKALQTTIFDKNNIQRNVKVVVDKDSDLADMSINEVKKLVAKLKGLGIDFDKMN